MIKTIIAVVSTVSILFLVILLNVTTPVSAGPLGILVIFIFAYLSLLGIITFSSYAVSKVTARLSRAFIPRKPIGVLSFRQSYYYSTVIALGPIMLVGLQSVRTVDIYEIILIIVFLVIGCLYVSRRIG